MSYKFTHNFTSNIYLPIYITASPYLCELLRKGNRKKKRKSKRGKGDTSEVIKSRKSLLNARQVIRDDYKITEPVS